MNKNDILDTAFNATCKLEFIRTVIETLINMLKDNEDIKTPEQETTIRLYNKAVGI